MSELLLNKALLKGISDDKPHHDAHQDDWLKEQDPSLSKTNFLLEIVRDVLKGDHKYGYSIELLVLALLTNGSGTGAMDVCSLSIKKITEETNELSDVQDDLIKFQRILSKIEAELGTKKDISKDDWNKFDKSLLKELKDVYTKLCKDQKTLAGNKDPKIKAVADMIGDFIKDLNTSVPTPSGDTGSLSSFAYLIEHWDGNTDFPLDGKNLANTLAGAVVALAKNFYDKNHPSSSGDANNDYLGEWVQTLGASEQLTTGTSQQETTAVQGYMQILNSYNNIGQQMIQSTAQGKESMVRNQRSG